MKIINSIRYYVVGMLVNIVYYVENLVMRFK